MTYTNDLITPSDADRVVRTVPQRKHQNLIDNLLHVAV